MKQLALSVLVALFLICATACSNTTTSNQTNAPTTPQPAKTVEFTVEGFYDLFGVMNGGSLVESSELKMESGITLENGGTGEMISDNESIEITKWELNGDVVSITLKDGGQADAKVHDGILELDLYGDASMVLYYAQKGADISGYEFASLEEVKAKNKD